MTIDDSAVNNIAQEPLVAVDDRAKGEEASTPKPTYVKLAMRNMVQKGRQSLVHFALTAIGLLSLLIGLAYLTR